MNHQWVFQIRSLYQRINFLSLNLNRRLSREIFSHIEDALSRVYNFRAHGQAKVMHTQRPKLEPFATLALLLGFLLTAPLL